MGSPPMPMSMPMPMFSDANRGDEIQESMPTSCAERVSGASKSPNVIQASMTTIDTRSKTEQPIPIGPMARGKTQSVRWITWPIRFASPPRAQEIETSRSRAGVWVPDVFGSWFSIRRYVRIRERLETIKPCLPLERRTELDIRESTSCRLEHDQQTSPIADRSQARDQRSGECRRHPNRCPTNG